MTPEPQPEQGLWGVSQASRSALESNIPLLGPPPRAKGTPPSTTRVGRQLPEDKGRAGFAS